MYFYTKYKLGGEQLPFGVQPSVLALEESPDKGKRCPPALTVDSELHLPPGVASCVGGRAHVFPALLGPG